MDRDAIKQAIYSRGYTIQLIAETLEVTHSAVTAVMSRRSSSKRIAVAIAKAIGKPISEVFPDVPEYENTTRPSTQSRNSKSAELATILR